MSDKDYKTMIGADARTFAGVSADGATADTLPVFVLKVVGGAQDGAMFPLDWTQTSRVLLGTSAGCEVQIKDAKVSRRHLSLGPHGGYLRLTDLTSTNGTKLNTVRVMEALLRGGETITVGDTMLKLLRMGDAHNPMQHDAEYFGRVLGRSSDMQRAFVIGARLAKTELPVLIEGETGTGKELFAEALHDASAHAAGPCAALSGLGTPAELSAALADDGVFAQAQSGTLILDEVSELPLAAQSRLLSLLIRSVATTKRDFDRESEAGRLNEELLFRIAGGRVVLPPLRLRHGDIALLAEYFWSIASQGHAQVHIPPQLMAQWHDYHWPGNVRELRHAIDRAVALGDLRYRAPLLSSRAKPCRRACGLLRCPLRQASLRRRCSQWGYRCSRRVHWL
jgi:two-component system, NtrC family, response regulator HydG